MLDFKLNVKTINKDGIVIRGTATSNYRDLDGESITISPNAFKKAIGTFLDNGGRMLVDHGFNPEFGSKVVGKVLNAEYSPADYSIDSPEPLNMKIDVVAMITDPKVIEGIMDGYYDSFSLSWKTSNWLMNEKTDQRIDTDVEIKELTVTNTPANTQATFSVVTDEDIAKQFKLGERVNVFDTVANVKCLYTDGKDYYADLEFADGIVNMKTAGKVSVKTYMDDIVVNVKSLIYDGSINGKENVGSGTTQLGDFSRFNPYILAEQIQDAIREEISNIYMNKDVDFGGHPENLSFYLKGDLAFDTDKGAFDSTLTLNSDGQIKVDIAGAVAMFDNIKVNIKKTFSNYPQSASNNAKKAIEWKEEHGDEVKGGTQVGWTRARQLVNREALSLDTIKRVKSFLARHEKNASVDPKFKDEPWKDAGHVAYLIWGGKSMKNYVDNLDLD